MKKSNGPTDPRTGRNGVTHEPLHTHRGTDPEDNEVLRVRPTRGYPASAGAAVGLGALAAESEV